MRAVQKPDPDRSHGPEVVATLVLVAPGENVGAGGAKMMEAAEDTIARESWEAFGHGRHVDIAADSDPEGPLIHHLCRAGDLWTRAGRGCLIWR